MILVSMLIGGLLVMSSQIHDLKIQNQNLISKIDLAKNFVRDYLENNSKCNITVLHSAAQNGELEKVTFLSEFGADVNARTCFNSTPLHGAVLKGHLEISKLLLQNGADVNAKNNRLKTPLNYAAGYGHDEIVKVLIQNGADINAKGQTVQ